MSEVEGEEGDRGIDTTLSNGSRWMAHYQKQVRQPLRGD
jgi:hypothetical protein